jgi:hypothetical protein
MTSMQRVLGQRLVHGFGQPKVDHFRHRLAVVQTNEHIRRFQVAMDDSLLMRVLHSLADRDKQLQSFLQRESRLVAVLRQWHAFDVFHGEEGAPLFRDTPIEDFGDVGMIHQCQGLAFGIEAGQHLF